MNKKILFVLLSDEFVRNFYDNKIINKLKKDYVVNFILQDTGVNKYKFLKKSKDCKGTFKYPKEQIKSFNFLNWSNSIINEELSKTFKFQNLGIFLRVYFRYPNQSIFNSLIYFIPRLFIKIRKYLFYYKFKNLDNNDKLKQDYQVSFKKNNIVNLIEKQKPDLIIFPTRGNNPALFEISNYYKNKTLLLCDNWDNPSSKSYLDPKPKYISVWGEQSKLHAIKCNNYKKENINILGTPKYLNFYKNRNKIKIKSHFKFKYILFLESWIYDGVQETLEQLDKIVSSSLRLRNFKILFRPHPFPSHTKKYDLSLLKNVVMDPDIRTDKNSLLNGRIITKLSYYPSLIKNAEIIICGPTTMLIESAMFSKKTILIGIDSPNYFNHKNTLHNMVHLKNLKKFSNLLINNDLKELEFQIIKLMDLKFNYNLRKKINRQLDYILTNKSEKYFHNFRKCIKKILS